MLFIEITKTELTGGRFRIMLFLEVENLEFPGGHFRIMLFIEMEKKEFPGGHFAFYREVNSNSPICIFSIIPVWPPVNSNLADL